MKDYKEKIKKLLALAESNNEHEAKAALLKAKELMAEHKIAEVDLIDAKNKNVKRIITEYEYTKRGEWWIGSLANIIAENYCCRSAGNKNFRGQKRTIIFVGLEGDVDICAKIFEYAVDTARSCGKSYLKNLDGWQRYTSAEKNRIKNSYAIGFARGVKVAFDEQKIKKEQDESGWGLVMIVPKEVNEACSNFVTDRYQSRHTVYSDVRDDGYQEGRKFNPHGKLSVAI